MNSWPSTRLDLDALPSKPFDMGEPIRKKAPLETHPFDWNSLPDTLFDYNNLPTKKLVMKATLLGKPEIKNAGIPRAEPGEHRGVLHLNKDFGLPGNAVCLLKDHHGAM